MLIRAAGERDLAVMQEIERAAGSWFREIGMLEIAEDEPLSLEELDRYQQENRAWVAVDDGDVPVAYLIASVVDGCMHIEQVSVHPRVMYDQLAQIGEFSARSYISVQVVPAGNGANAGLGGPLNISSGDGAPDVVHMDAVEGRPRSGGRWSARRR